MSLTGNMIASAIGGNPSIVNYVMFVAVISMGSLIYLIAASVNEGFAGHPKLPLGVDILNALLTLIGGIAMAGYLGVNSCNDPVSKSCYKCEGEH
jgi:hypothetical protein